MKNLYLIENSPVLKNLLGITDEKELDLAEVELSRANMMLLYENGFNDFSSNSFKRDLKLAQKRGFDIQKLKRFFIIRKNIMINYK